MIRLVSLAIMLSLFVTILLPKQKAEAWTTGKLAYLCGIPFYEDGVYNYDFVSQWPNSSNVDWPVNLVFAGLADIDLVKNELWGDAPFWDGEMWNYCFDGSVPGEWHKDRGTKSGFPYATHMRPYAPYNGYQYSFYNTSWLFYCVGTSHRDLPPNYGYSEDAEGRVCDQLRYKPNWVVWDDYYNFYNYESSRTESDGLNYHRWQNDGWASEAFYFIWF